MNQSRAFKYILPATALLTALIYCLGLHGAFVYDDYRQIVTRKELHNIFNFHDVIFCNLRQNRVWQNISFALNWTIAPGQTWSFKLFSLTLHLINGSLVYLWLKKLFADKPYLPILAASLFWIHPLQIQSVSYAMGADILFHGFFNLLALWWYSKYSLSRMPGLILILAASLLARETCVLIPFILLVYEILIHRTSFKELPKRKWLILFLIPFLYYPLSVILKDPGISMYAGTTGTDLYPFWKHLVSQLYFQSFYLTLFMNPTLQSILHGNPSINEPVVILGAVMGACIWIGGALFLLLKNKKMPRASFLVFLFFLNYLPTNSFLQMVNPFAEYRLYMSNLLLCVLLAFALHQLSSWLTKKAKLTTAEITIPAIVLVSFGIFTMQNVMIWKDWKLIYSQAVKRYPMNDYNYVAMGAEYLHENNLSAAMDNYIEARVLSGWLNAELETDYYLVAVSYYNAGDFVHAWEIMDRMAKDFAKEPLDKSFFVFKDTLEEKIKSLGLKTESHWDYETKMLNTIRSNQKDIHGSK